MRALCHLHVTFLLIHTHSLSLYLPLSLSLTHSHICLNWVCALTGPRWPSPARYGRSTWNGRSTWHGRSTRHGRSSARHDGPWRTSSRFLEYTTKTIHMCLSLFLSRALSLSCTHAFVHSCSLLASHLAIASNGVRLVIILFFLSLLLFLSLSLSTSCVRSVSLSLLTGSYMLVVRCCVCVLRVYMYVLADNACWYRESSALRKRSST